MYRAALRATTPCALRPAAAAAAPRRLASTASKAKKGTWKGAALRWGLAAGAVYFYNTSSLFENDVPPQSGPAPSPFSDADLPTVDALVQEKRKQALPRPAPKAAAPAEKKADTVAAATVTKPETAPAPQPAASETAEKEEGGLTESAGALEHEAAAEGAFNPETGEINWDCPCLGGMAHGPCGEQFKAAFSCFVYSTEEPKGMDCIDKFQGMQDCFREYPELYGAELADDDTPTFDEEPKKPVELPAATSESTQVPSAPEAETVKEVVQEKVKEIKEEVIPEKSHDATAANKDKTQ